MISSTVSAMFAFQREIFETEMRSLKNELERAVGSLNEAELCIQAKTQQLAECQKEITHQTDLLGQQENQTKHVIQEKEEMLYNLQQELSGQGVVLQQEIQDLKFQLQQAEQHKCHHISRLQQHIVEKEEEVEKLKKIVKEKEDRISLTEENMNDLNAKFSALSSLLIVKDRQINSLREEMDILEAESKMTKNELQNKNDMLATLTLEKYNEQQLMENQIQLFTIQVENLSLSLKQAEQDIQNKQGLLVESQQLNVQQQQRLHKQIVACEDEINLKDEQLAILKNDSSCQVVSLEKEMEELKGQLEYLNNHLRKAKEQLRHEKVKLVKHEKDSDDQIQLLQEQLSACGDEVRAMKEEVRAREDQMATLQKQSFDQSQKFNEEIDNLQNQIQSLQFSLRNAEENMQTKENLLVEQKLQASRDMEVLRVQMVTSHQETEVLTAKISEKEKQILLLKTADASHSKLIQQEIESLNEQMQTISNSLDLAQEELQTKEDAIAKQERDSIHQKELLQQQLLAAEEEVKRLTKDCKTKGEQMIQLSTVSSAQLDLLQENILELDEQIGCLLSTAKDADDMLQFYEHHLNSTHDEDFQKKMEMSQGEVTRLKVEISANERDLARLKNSSSLDWELLQQEIACLTTQIKSINALLGTVRKQTRAKEAAVLQQEQEHILQIEEFTKQNSVLEEGVALLKEELQTQRRKINMMQSEGGKESEMTSTQIQTLTDKIKRLNALVNSAVEQEDELLLLAQDMETSQEGSKVKGQTALEVETMVLGQQMAPFRTTSSKHHQEIQMLHIQMDHLDSVLKKACKDLRSKDNLFQKEEENTRLREMVKRLQEQILSQEEQIEKQKVTENERKHLHLKTEERLLFFQNELSALNMVMKEKVGNLNALKEENAAQANVVQQEALGYETRLTMLKEEHSKRIQELQLEIQQMNEQVEMASQKVVAKEQEFLQMNRDSAKEVHRLQQQLISAKAEKQAAYDLQLVTHNDRELLMVRVGQAEKERGALEKQLEAVILQKDEILQAKEAIERKSETAEHYKAQVGVVI